MPTTIRLDDPNLLLSPYVWRPSGSADAARIEAMLPGAYIKALVSGTTAVRILIDGSANAGCLPNSMPWVEWSVDYGPFQTLHLDRTDGVYAVTLAEGLAPESEHRIEFFLRAADLGTRWTESKNRLRLAGLEVDKGGKLIPFPRRPKLAIGFGDSITEGVGVESPYNGWRTLDPHNALKTWFPLLATALDCEYGQVGSSGQGMMKPGQLPPISESWSFYEEGHSRLKNGRLEPEPDYVFCNHGTNDSGLDVTAAYGKWLESVRAACPSARIFCVIPFLGWKRDEIGAAVANRHKSGDKRVFLIDSGDLTQNFSDKELPTSVAYDGVHPNAYGQALVAARLAVEVQKVLDQKA